MGLYDLVELTTTVTAQSGATVTLASVEGLEVGDKIIIESQHGYDEPGLDGSWAISNFPLGVGYYTNVTHVGKSFISGPITNIAGNVVTVDRTVPSGAVGLPCYRNNADAVKYTVDNLLPWPANKRLAVATATSAPIRSYLTDTYAEIDFNHCELFAPRGTGALRLAIARISGGGLKNKRYRNLTLRGNVRDSGYGLSVEGGTFVQGSSMYFPFNILGSGGEGGGLAINCVIENFTFIDNWRSTGVDLALDSFVVNCRSQFTDPLRQYIQWEYQAASSERCAFIDCTIDSDYMRASFEPYKCKGISFIRCGGRNTSFAVNSSGSTIFKDCWITIDDTNPDPSFSPSNFLLNLARTQETQQGEQQPGTGGGVGVFNFRIQYDAIPYGDTDAIWGGVAINAEAAWGLPVNAHIYGLDFQVPRTDVAFGANTGYIVNRNSGAGGTTIVSGITGDTLDTGTKLLNVTETL